MSYPIYELKIISPPLRISDGLGGLKQITLNEVALMVERRARSASPTSGGEERRKATLMNKVLLDTCLEVRVPIVEE
jgi:hypothetical protein